MNGVDAAVVDKGQGLAVEIDIFPRGVAGGVGLGD